LLRETIGYNRQFDFEFPLLEVADDLDLANFRGVARLTHTAQGVYLHGQFSGERQLDCVRCLTEINQRIKSRLEQLYEFPPNPLAEFTVEESGFLDLAPALREDLWLAMPQYPLCRPDCRGLCPNCGQNWNDGSCNCANDNINPQLEVLKKLLDN